MLLSLPPPAPSSGVQDPPALTLALTPTHRTHIWTHFQVDLLLVVVPQLLGGLGLFGDVGFLGILDEIRVVFPSAGREVGKGERQGGGSGKESTPNLTAGQSLHGLRGWGPPKKSTRVLGEI